LLFSDAQAVDPRFANLLPHYATPSTQKLIGGRQYSIDIYFRVTAVG